MELTRHHRRSRGARSRARRRSRAIEAELERADRRRSPGHAFNINSSKQLGTVLFEELKLPIVSHTKTGWSTSIEALERIEHAHPIVPLVLRWRAAAPAARQLGHLAARAASTPTVACTRASTPRARSRADLVNTNPDLGRVPGRTPEMARIRRAFVAPPGHLLMSVDFNQLGLHVLAHLTKDPALVEPLRARARHAHGSPRRPCSRSPLEAITADERQLGKVVNFATFAGQGASALALQLGIPPAEAKEYIARFDRHYAQVRAFQDEQLRLARERGYIVTIAGRRWPIGGLESLDLARPLVRRAARAPRDPRGLGRRRLAPRAARRRSRAARATGLGARPAASRSSTRSCSRCPRPSSTPPRGSRPTRCATRSRSRCRCARASRPGRTGRTSREAINDTAFRRGRRSRCPPTSGVDASGCSRRRCSTTRRRRTCDRCTSRARRHPG